MEGAIFQDLHFISDDVHENYFYFIRIFNIRQCHFSNI